MNLNARRQFMPDYKKSPAENARSYLSFIQKLNPYCEGLEYSPAARISFTEQDGTLDLEKVYKEGINTGVSLADDHTELIRYAILLDLSKQEIKSLIGMAFSRHSDDLKVGDSKKLTDRRFQQLMKQSMDTFGLRQDNGFRYPYEMDTEPRL